MASSYARGLGGLEKNKTWAPFPFLKKKWLRKWVYREKTKSDGNGEKLKKGRLVAGDII